MRAKHVAMAAVLTVAPAVGAFTQDQPPSHVAKASVEAPVWPSNGVAERELGDGKESWPENMFVEHSNGRWIVWVLLSSNSDKSKAMDFFSGEIRDVKIKKFGGYIDSFVDSEGESHVSDSLLDFRCKEIGPGGTIGSVVFNVSTLRFNREFAYAPILEVSQRISPDGKAVVWRKVPLFNDSPSDSPYSEWASFISRGMDLHDGTMLVTGGRYVFRVREDDLTPVGHASHLHVVEEDQVKRIIDKSEKSDIDDAHGFLTDELHLN
ncbi:hypothetical protein [Luteibacter sp. W1I16]|uniref:hypothetical protein n=1 Tax=Luteibacter sp. W1I16 TaxID=3373922 RepID=UPI003D22571B